MEWMESSSETNYDKYKSYIQRRRIVPVSKEFKEAGEKSGGEDKEPMSADADIGENDVRSSSKSYAFDSAMPEATEDGLWSSLGSRNAEDRSTESRSTGEENPIDDYNLRESYSGQDSALRSYQPSTFRKVDPALYRRMQKTNAYPAGHTQAFRSPLPSGDSYRAGTAGHTYRQAHADREGEGDSNRINVLAVKIIKQSLACFALLGIILLMQERTDMAPALAFVKKQVVETHIEPQSLLDGFQNLVAECSKWLGGSP